MKYDRDLIVVLKDDVEDENEIELKVEQINKLLYHFESFKNFCISNEILDLNKYKRISKPHLILAAIKKPQMRPFEFIINKN